MHDREACAFDPRGVTGWIAAVGITIIASAAGAEPRTTIAVDVFVIHRPIRDPQASVGYVNSAFDVVITRELIGRLYIGAEAGLMHVGALVGARWLSGGRTGLLAAVEARAAEEVLVGPAVYGRVAVGWAFASGLIITPAFETGRCWDAMGNGSRASTVDVVGGTLEVAYGW
jgi:hypothetical protein